MHVYNNGYNNLISYIISLPITVIRQVNNITRIKLSFVLKIKKKKQKAVLCCFVWLSTSLYNVMFPENLFFKVLFVCQSCLIVHKVIFILSCHYCSLYIITIHFTLKLGKKTEVRWNQTFSDFSFFQELFMKDRTGGFLKQVLVFVQYIDVNIGKKGLFLLILQCQSLGREIHLVLHFM